MAYISFAASEPCAPAIPERIVASTLNAIQREHKHYPALQETRTEWRKRYAAQETAIRLLFRLVSGGHWSCGSITKFRPLQDAPHRRGPDEDAQQCELVGDANAAEGRAKSRRGIDRDQGAFRLSTPS